MNTKQDTDLDSSTLGSTWLKRLFVIKIGGNIIDDEIQLSSFLKNFVNLTIQLQVSGAACMLIHGGGKIATSVGDKLGIKSKYLNGRRITNDETLDLVTMVYGGLVNKKLVAQLQGLKCNAIGLTGADGNIIPAKKRPVEQIDYGWVGDIDNSMVNTEGVNALLHAGFVPVFAPLTHDGEGHLLNTNADTIASSLAVALSALYKVRLLYCFEKKGVLNDLNDENSVIAQMTKQSYAQMLDEERIVAGMLPKINNAFAAIDAGVSEVIIGHSNDLLQNTTDQTSGTLFTK